MEAIRHAAGARRAAPVLVVLLLGLVVVGDLASFCAGQPNAATPNAPPPPPPPPGKTDPNANNPPKADAGANPTGQPGGTTTATALTTQPFPPIPSNVEVGPAEVQTGAKASGAPAANAPNPMRGVTPQFTQQQLQVMNARAALLRNPQTQQQRAAGLNSLDTMRVSLLGGGQPTGTGTTTTGAPATMLAQNGGPTTTFLQTAGAAARHGRKERTSNAATHRALTALHRARSATCAGCTAPGITPAIWSDAKIAAIVSQWGDRLDAANLQNAPPPQVPGTQFVVLRTKTMSSINLGALGNLLAPCAILRENRANGGPRIWVVHRGSESILDWMLDAVFDGVPYKVGGAQYGVTHQGFTLGWEALGIVDDILNVVRSTPDLANADVQFTGHSLGAALSVLASVEYSLRAGKVPRVYTFGCPRPGNGDFANAVKQRVFHYRFINNNDLVPKVPIWGNHAGLNVQALNPLPFLYRQGSDYAVRLASNQCQCVSDSSGGSLIGASTSDHAISAYVAAITALAQ